MKPITACILFLFSFIISPNLPAMSADELGREMKTSFEKFSVVGLSVVAVQNGRVTWNTNFGLADIDRKLPVTDQTKFRIASISKLVTATALMQLWEKKKFKLDDDISQHLGYTVRNPNFPDKPITFQHLLTHTSSMVDVGNYDRFLQASYQNHENALNFREILGAGGSYYEEGASFSKKYAPGTDYSYSNQAYGLLGTLVEKISGERFDRYCEKNIFKPLQMTASFNPNHIPNVDDLGVLYRKENEQWKPQADNYRGERPAERGGSTYKPGHNALPMSPQGGLRVSALDMAKFMISFMDSPPRETKRVLRKKTIQMMTEEHWPKDAATDDKTIRGLGFHLTPNLTAGDRWIGHSGNAYGLLSDMYFKGNNGVVLITSGSVQGKEIREFSEMERAVIEPVIRFLTYVHRRP